MKHAVAVLIMGFSLCAYAAPEKELPACESPLTNGVGYKISDDSKQLLMMIVNPVVAQALYDGMTEVKEDKLESDHPYTRKTGKSAVCFKQILQECTRYTCNVMVKNLATGEVVVRP